MFGTLSIVSSSNVGKPSSAPGMPRSASVLSVSLAEIRKLISCRHGMGRTCMPLGLLGVDVAAMAAGYTYLIDLRNLSTSFFKVKCRFNSAIAPFSFYIVPLIKFCPRNRCPALSSGMSYVGPGAYIISLTPGSRILDDLSFDPHLSLLLHSPQERFHRLDVARAIPSPVVAKRIWACPSHFHIRVRVLCPRGFAC